jgi:hypothetical protein
MNYWLSGGLVWSMSVLSNNLSQQQNGYTVSKFWHYLTLAGPLLLIGGLSRVNVNATPYHGAAKLGEKAIGVSFIT